MRPRDSEPLSPIYWTYNISWRYVTLPQCGADVAWRPHCPRPFEEGSHGRCIRLTSPCYGRGTALFYTNEVATTEQQRLPIEHLVVIFTCPHANTR